MPDRSYPNVYGARRGTGIHSEGRLLGGKSNVKRGMRIVGDHGDPGCDAERMSFLAAVWFGSAGRVALAQTTISPAPTGPYTSSPLPYPYEALEPLIDTITMQIHHDKHHKTYAHTANTLLADQPELAKLSPEDPLKNLSKAPEAIRTGLCNNVGGTVYEDMSSLSDLRRSTPAQSARARLWLIEMQAPTSGIQSVR
jgi:hypothetical protein